MTSNETPANASDSVRVMDSRIVLSAGFVLFGAFVYTNMSRSLVRAVDETLQLAAVELMTKMIMHDETLVFVENPIGSPPSPICVNRVQYAAHGYEWNSNR